MLAPTWPETGCAQGTGWRVLSHCCENSERSQTCAFSGTSLPSVLFLFIQKLRLKATVAFLLV